MVPFRFFDLRVTRAHALTPSLIRVTFQGFPDDDALDAFASGGRDQSLSLFLPHPHQDAPVVPVDAGDGSAIFAAWRALPEDTRAVMRSYTVRDQRRTATGAREFDIDFAVHENGGPACRWAQAAAPGKRAMVLGPAVAENTSVRCQPPADTDWTLIWGDETALPAIAAILEWLPAGMRTRVWVDVPHAADRLELKTDADAEIVWLVRDEGAPSAVEAVTAAELPEGTPYAWIAGESGGVKALRRHLVGERGIDRRRVTFVGYWRRGVSEDGLRDDPALAEIDES
ncbi:siderophore-interacting protein [Streptomyces tsukubensis]|uniref:NADPH-dependent ferric siderophore reductase n=1 Tax=Streptomyces tsukubensis (strain DSM 42081 / NBRC 108919 / NRRL 18488 / 9993) TaxID=1114943 RepID=A0A7G3UK63_STRT9|nr:siderophore-interacting protein [Streptomyces tsukubensis]AZK94168.1 NADPH-dependent ferric siderophore reductase [Streptomyces tsukubensis]QKM69729.1 NADPH-dependent ferric siderophore reductase [Streptomyces tsukubensis NRRL18488]TAI46307.1 siderophore-interacting protein [Streptomyces tsukubensis]